MLFVIGCTAEPEALEISRPEALSTTETAEFSASMLDAVNAVRANGCTCGNTLMPSVSPLTWNDQLTDAADRHAYDMYSREFFDHKGSDASRVGDRTTDAGYTWSRVGENIARADGDVEEVVKGWLTSIPHCKQLMSADFVDMGAAQRGEYWVQVFGKSVEH